MRESQGSPGQYVLTGMNNSTPKHLLLIDPEGVVSISKINIMKNFIYIYKGKNIRICMIYFNSRFAQKIAFLIVLVI